MGEVSDGHICLTGRLKPATFSIAVICDDKLNHDVNSTELQGSSGDIVGIVYVDVPSDLRDKEEVSLPQSTQGEFFVRMFAASETFRDLYRQGG